MTDVSVQYFSHLNGLQLDNRWGDMINLLDTCLVNGIPLPYMTDVTVEPNGNLKVITDSVHNCLQFQIVEFKNFNPASLNGKYRIIGVPNTTSLILKATNAILPVTIGQAKLVSLGYEIVYTATNKRVYRALNPRNEHPYIRVDETITDGTNSYTASYAKYAMVGLIENMTHIDDYQDPTKLQLPLDTTDLKKNWKISGTGTSVIRGWSRWYSSRASAGYNAAYDTTPPSAGPRFFTLVGNSDFFYLSSEFTPNGVHKQIVGCGLFQSSLNTSVIPNWFLMSPTHNLIANTSVDHTAYSGGWPLQYAEKCASFHIFKYDLINRVSDSIFSKPMLPDFKSGSSGLYSGTDLAALQIPFSDSDLKLRGTLPIVCYAGNVQNTVKVTTPRYSETSMYVYDGSADTPSTGGNYYYLGEM